MLEEYKSFHGYKVSNYGNIISLQGRPLSIRNNNGRYETRLNINGKRQNFIVARLVYYLFKGFDIENKNMCIINKDDNTLNVRIDNLMAIERKNLIQGEHHVKVSKLTNEQIEEIRELYKGTSGTNQYDKVGYSYNDLAKIYGVTKGNIASIIKNRSRYSQEYKLK